MLLGLGKVILLLRDRSTCNLIQVRGPREFWSYLLGDIVWRQVSETNMVKEMGCQVHCYKRGHGVYEPQTKILNYVWKPFSLSGFSGLLDVVEMAWTFCEGSAVSQAHFPAYCATCKKRGHITRRWEASHISLQWAKHKIYDWDHLSLATSPQMGPASWTAPNCGNRSQFSSDQ